MTDHVFFKNDEKSDTFQQNEKLKLIILYLSLHCSGIFTLMALLYVAHCRGFVLMVIVIVKLFPRPDRPTNLQDQNYFQDFLVNFDCDCDHQAFPSTSIEHEASYCEQGN